jgi:hypothetical protein
MDRELPRNMKRRYTILSDFFSGLSKKFGVQKPAKVVGGRIPEQKTFPGRSLLQHPMFYDAFCETPQSFVNTHNVLRENT